MPAKKMKDGKSVYFIIDSQILAETDQFCRMAHMTRTEAISKALERYLEDYRTDDGKDPEKIRYVVKRPDDTLAVKDGFILGRIRQDNIFLNRVYGPNDDRSGNHIVIIPDSDIVWREKTDL